MATAQLDELVESVIQEFDPVLFPIGLAAGMAYGRHKNRQKASQMRVGRKVYHHRHGVGHVTGWNNRRVSVKFGDGNEREIPWGSVHLRESELEEASSWSGGERPHWLFGGKKKPRRKKPTQAQRAAARQRDASARRAGRRYREADTDPDLGATVGRALVAQAAGRIPENRPGGSMTGFHHQLSGHHVIYEHGGRRRKGTIVAHFRRGNHIGMIVHDHADGEWREIAASKALGIKRFGYGDRLANLEDAHLDAIEPLEQRISRKAALRIREAALQESRRRDRPLKSWRPGDNVDTRSLHTRELIRAWRHHTARAQKYRRAYQISRAAGHDPEELEPLFQAHELHRRRAMHVHMEFARRTGRGLEVATGRGADLFEAGWMQKAMSRPGARGGLHRSLGVPEGQPIPPEKLRAALAGRYGPRAKAQAQMARNMMRSGRGRRRRSTAGR